MTERAALPAGMHPRLLSREEAAAYCGVSPRVFSENVAKRIRKTKIGRSTRYDVRALDSYLNRLAGLKQDGGDEEAVALKALDGIGTPSLRHRAA